jgi:hypothetical protein
MVTCSIKRQENGNMFYKKTNVKILYWNCAFKFFIKLYKFFISLSLFLSSTYNILKWNTTKILTI